MTTEPTGPEADKQAAKDRIAAIAAAPSPWPWLAIPPLKPWRNFATGTIPVAVRRRAEYVEVRGAVIGGGRGQPVFTLPENCRPPGLMRFPIAIALSLDIRTIGTAQVAIDAAGNVVIETNEWSANPRYFDLGSISFAVDDELAETIKRDAERARPKAKATRTESSARIVKGASEYAR